MSNNLFGRVVKIHIEDDDEKPNETTVSIFNLSASSINRIKKGGSITVQAGYKSDYGILAKGKISRVSTVKDGVNRITTIYMLEGQDYSGKKTKEKITFKAGTKADVIIKRLANVLGFKLMELKLPKNVVYKKGYTVTGNIENNLLEVVKDCGASMSNRRGGRVIRSIKRI